MQQLGKTDMYAMNIAFIIFGLILLAASLKPACEIKNADKTQKWTALCVLIVAFILGYLFVLYFLSTEKVEQHFALVLSSILAGGGVFVYIVTILSCKSIRKLGYALERQRFLAEHDTITGHFNRSKFIYDLNEKVDNQQHFDLLLLGINKFRHIIDVHDHEFVDALLNQLSNRICQDLGINVPLYRIDGGEFALLIDNHHASEIDQVLQSIDPSQKKEFSILNKVIHIDVIIGVSRFPSMATLSKSIFKQADLAFHEAKATNRPCVFYFDELGKRAEESQKMHARIKNALKNNEFELYLQPIIVANNGKVDGAEALIRWPQKDGSFIRPDLFISIAEKSGLINEVSRWVVLETIQLISQLKQAGFDGTIHVNLSTKDIESKAFFEFVEKQVAKNPSISSSIIFEITEYAMMTNFDEARDTMLKLTNMGFKFSIDDFGTGFSSLTLLRELPISQIKIDRSFVSEMLKQNTDLAIVESTLFLASKLNCNVVAEGVENEELQQKLSEIGCHFLQGFYFSKPIPFDDYINIFLRNDLIASH